MITNHATPVLHYNIVALSCSRESSRECSALHCKYLCALVVKGKNGVISGDWGRREMIMLEMLQVTSDKLLILYDIVA